MQISENGRVSLSLNKDLEYRTIRDLKNHKPDLEKARKYGIPPNVERVLVELETPEYVQVWVDQNLKYDHQDIGLFGGVGKIIETGLADCFRGMLVIYTLLYFRRYDPSVVLLQAGVGVQGQDHNIVVYKGTDIDGQFGYGSIAFSDWSTLKYRPPIFKSIHDLAASYWPAYVSEVPQFRNHHNLKGFTEPLNLMELFGEENLFRMLFSDKRNATERIFRHYTDAIFCTDLKTGARYPYPVEETMSIPTRRLLDIGDR